MVNQAASAARPAAANGLVLRKTIRSAARSSQSSASSPSGPVSASVDNIRLCAQVRMKKPGSTRS